MIPILINFYYFQLLPPAGSQHCLRQLSLATLIGSLATGKDHLKELQRGNTRARVDEAVRELKSTLPVTTLLVRTLLVMSLSLKVESRNLNQVRVKHNYCHYKLYCILKYLHTVFLVPKPDQSGVKNTYEQIKGKELEKMELEQGKSLT